MAQKKYQRGIIHSSEEIKKLIDFRINDITAKSNKSVSEILEKAILDSLFAENKDAQSFIINGLYPQDGNGSVRQTLDDVFRWNNAGIDLNSKHDNLRPLVDFCLFNMDGTQLLPENNPAMQSFLYCLNSIVRRTEKEADSIENIINKSQYLYAAGQAKKICQQAKDDPTQIRIMFVFEVILDLWELIKGWSMTYRALSALASMSTFHENSETRNALVDLVNQISKEW